MFTTSADYDPRIGPGMSLTAYFETGGIRGTICFTQAEPGAPVTITVNVDGLDQFEPRSFDWEITEYPIQFSEYPDFPCTDLGSKDSLSMRHGRLDSTGSHTFIDDELDLFGPDSPVGRAITISHVIRQNLPVSCANIEYQGISLQTLRAGFNGPELMGDVIFRRQNGRPGATIHVQLCAACNFTVLQGLNLDWSLRTGTCDDIGPVSGNQYLHLQYYTYICSNIAHPGRYLEMIHIWMTYTMEPLTTVLVKILENVQVGI